MDNHADPLFALSGKVALVTGGTGGIGGMIARALVARGVRTYLTGRDGQAASVAASTIAAQGGGTCIGLACDLSDPAAPADLARLIAEREDALHLLVNNAGTVANDDLASATATDWDRVMGVNLRAPFLLTQALLPVLRAAAMPDDPARVINIGSIGGLHVPGWEAHAYGASKAALHHLTRSLAKALGAHHVTVNAIAPGPFPSGLTDTASAAVQRSVAANIPLGRPGQAQDIEGAVVFLASRAGAYVNGHTLPLDGGYIAAL